MERNNTITVIGLGKLGSPMLACFASKGFNVIGVDVNPTFVDSINNKKSPVEEPGVTELLQKSKDRVYATMDLTHAIKNSFISFIIVPSPSLENGSFSTAYVEAVIRQIGTVLKDIDDYHVVNIVSTILPGATEEMQKILEDVSGKVCCKDFGLVFNPDFIALGSVVHDFLNPDMIIIGESDHRTGFVVEKVHRKVVDNDPKIYRTNYYNAEFAKISVNTYLTMKINFANGIAEICENMPGGKAEDVLQVLGADTRIGKKYLKPGLAAMGPCLVRDSKAFCSVANKFGVSSFLAEATDTANMWQRERIKNMVLSLLKREYSIKDKNWIPIERVSILGLSYKPFTPVIEESIPIYVLKELLKLNIKVKVYDPAAIETTKKEVGTNSLLKYCKNIEECLTGTSLCFVATAWPEFESISESTFTELMEDPVILDAWGLYSFKTSKDMQLIKIGQHI